MARAKEYDKEEILELATELFWLKGFKATSINDIVKATGLNKHSMYEEFKNKEGLFKEVLYTYMNKLQKENSKHLIKEPLGIKNIENYLLNKVNYATEETSKGCMVVNCLAEKESLDNDIWNYVQTLLNGYEELIQKCLKAAQKNKEIPETKDIKVLAKYIVNFSCGLSITGKIKQKKEDYLAMLDFLMESIKK